MGSCTESPRALHQPAESHAGGLGQSQLAHARSKQGHRRAAGGEQGSAGAGPGRQPAFSGPPTCLLLTFAVLGNTPQQVGIQMSILGCSSLRLGDPRRGGLSRCLTPGLCSVFGKNPLQSLLQDQQVCSQKSRRQSQCPARLPSIRALWGQRGSLPTEQRSGLPPASRAALHVASLPGGSLPSGSVHHNLSRAKGEWAGANPPVGPGCPGCGHLTADPEAEPGSRQPTSALLWALGCLVQPVLDEHR